MKNIHKTGKELYITSDEEIKEGDWVYCTERKLFGKVIEIQLTKFESDTSMLYFEINDEEIWCKLFNCKKIILTTDQDLIGVQPIDDDFLEWFVKNPSCEEVKVIKHLLWEEYKIIIPKKEPKIYFQVDYFNDEFPKEEQSTKDRILSETPDEVKQRVRDRANSLVNKEETKCYCGHTTTCDCGTEEPKQETLEEVAEIYAVNKSSADVFRKAHREDFINGAKWQQERSYSEQDMIDFAYYYTEERKNKGARALTPELLIKQYEKEIRLCG